MRKISRFSLIFLFIASLFSPQAISASTLQQDTPASANKIYERIDLPKQNPQKAAALEEKYKKDQQQFKKVKKFSSAELNQFKQTKGKFDSAGSQGKIIEGQDALTPKSSSPAAASAAAPTVLDNRVKVTNTTVSPYNAIAQIDFRDSAGNWYICSGSFLDETTVLTAAHCVYDNNSHEFYTYWNVYPGENGPLLPYGSVSSTNVYAPVGWVTSTAPGAGLVSLGDVQYDYAVIKVNSSHAPRLPVSSASLLGDSIVTHGYPGDKGVGGYYYLYKSAGSISNFIDNAIIHTGSVTGGMSGGPILKGSSIISVNSTASWGPRFGATHLNNIEQLRALPY